VRRLSLLLLAAALSAPLAAFALSLPEPIVREFPQLRMAGEGRLRWFGLLIYDASLWVDGGQWSQQREFALDIRYARDLKGSKLAETSIEEMRRLGFGNEAQLIRWGAELARLLPDVRKGEHITGVNRPGRGVRFYYQGRLAGGIDDPEFARGFFAIWLDERTREPRLRQALFGNK
jgi:Chalcone isomerase-like